MPESCIRRNEMSPCSSFDAHSANTIQSTLSTVISSLMWDIKSYTLWMNRCGFNCSVGMHWQHPPATIGHIQISASVFNGEDLNRVPLRYSSQAKWKMSSFLLVHSIFWLMTAAAFVSALLMSTLPHLPIQPGGFSQWMTPDWDLQVFFVVSSVLWHLSWSCSPCLLVQLSAFPG